MDWAVASSTLSTASGVPVESTAVDPVDGLVEPPAASKHAGTSKATAAMVTIIRALNFIVLLLNCWLAMIIQSHHRARPTRLGLPGKRGNRASLPSFRALDRPA